MWEGQPVSVTGRNIVSVRLPRPPLSSHNFSMWEIQWRPVATGEWQAQNVSIDSTAITFQGDLGGGRYDVRARAVGPSSRSLYTSLIVVSLPSLCKSEQWGWLECFL